MQSITITVIKIFILYLFWLITSGVKLWILCKYCEKTEITPDTKWEKVERKKERKKDVNSPLDKK